MAPSKVLATNFPDRLPTTPQKLHQFLLVHTELLNAHRAKLRAIDKIDGAYSARQTALSDAQDLAELLLDAESRLGEFLTNLPKQRRRGVSTKKTSLRSLPDGLDKKESHRAQVIYKNPEVVELVKQRARKNGKLATTAEVLREVAKSKAKERHQKTSNEFKKALRRLSFIQDKFSGFLTKTSLDLTIDARNTLKNIDGHRCELNAALKDLRKTVTD